MDISVLEWNINQRAGHHIILSWVLAEVIVKDPDIIVLTEFCTKCEEGNKFIEDLEDKKYQCFISGNPKGNDVLIAVKKHFRVFNITRDFCYGERVKNPHDIPENLRVNIDCGGRTLTIVGIRIKSLDLGKTTLKEINEHRLAEFLWMLNWLKDIKNPIIIAGDFNNYRRGTPCQQWSIAQIDRMLPEGFVRITPDGGSIYEADKISEDQFAEDHFIIKGIRGLTLFPYDRGFTKVYKEYYPAGENFQWFKDEHGEIHCARNASQFKEYKKKYDKPESIKAGHPDHAILRGIFTLGQ